MKIQNLIDAKKIFAKKIFFILGIGVRAFTRITPSFFIDRKKYNILYFEKTNDLKIIQNYTNLISYDRFLKPGKRIDKVDTKEMLLNKNLIKFLSKQKNVYLNIYKNNFNIESIANKYGLKIIGNSADLMQKYENKAYFRKLLQKLKINKIANETINRKDFLSKNYNYFQSKYGKHVIQLADYIKGGGLGTIFIRNRKNFEDFRKFTVIGIYKQDVKINLLNIAEFVEGTAMSANGCVTKHGIIVSGLRTMIIDIPEVRNTNLGSGLFCGHDWTYKKITPGMQEQANKIIKTLGSHFSKEGYKGIFGVDFIFDDSKQLLYPIECNPRYTGNFPADSLYDLQQRNLNLDIFNLLEHMDIDYDIDVKKIEQNIQKPKKLSHLYLTHLKDRDCLVKTNFPVGIYRKISNSLKFIKKSFLPLDILKDSDFIITENLLQGELMHKTSEPSRLMRLIFRKSILESNHQLKVDVKKIITFLYHKIMG